jgi:DNA-binding transcriptional MerR regulator
MTKLLTKKELFDDLEKYFAIKYGFENLTERIFYHYISIGLIEVGKQERGGRRGSTSYYPQNTAGIIYLIESLKDRGFTLGEIKEYLDLLKLDNIEKIKSLKTEYDMFKKQIGIYQGITNDIRETILNEVPLRLLNLKNFKITRYEKLKSVIELRAYAELDYRELTDKIIEFTKDKDIKTLNKIGDILDKPEIEINTDKPEITVTYKKPLNKKVIFTPGSIEVV